jgi:type IV pilus assembly protein PilM
LPIPLEEAVLDWQLLSEWTDEETGQTVRRVLLVVAYRELVERYVLACKKAGISVAGIDLEAFAMLRALAEPPAADSAPATGAQVVVNVGHDRSTFAVSDGRVCEFTRVLGWGGQNLSVAIARALDITPSEATPIKHVLSLVAQSAPPEGISPEALGAAREAVTRELQSFARELVSSLRFYQNQPGSLGIGQLVLTGGSAHLPGFADELHRLIGVPVTVGDPLNRVAIPKKFREPEYALGSLTVAIGLGIED